MLQLIVGALGEVFALYTIERDGRVDAGERDEEKKACSIALVLFLSYIVLFTRDLMNRGTKVTKVKEK